MSSILRALKKLENEPRHQEEAKPLESKFFSLADTEPQRPVSSAFLRVVGGGIVCGLVILAGWWFFSAKLQSPTTVAPKISSSASRPDKVSPGTDRAANAGPGKVVTEKSQLPSMATIAPQEKTTLAEDQPTAAVSGEQSLPAKGQEVFSSADEQLPGEESPVQKTPALKTGEQPRKTVAGTSVASLRPSPSPAETVERQIPKLNNPDMRLQAVTWSKIPYKRIAVINNRILREGEMISGYLVNTINQDDVVLSQKGEKWRLLFRIK